MEVVQRLLFLKGGEVGRRGRGGEERVVEETFFSRMTREMGLGGEVTE